MSRRTAVALIVALGVALAAPAPTGGDARAQTWKPKTRRGAKATSADTKDDSKRANKGRKRANKGRKRANKSRKRTRARTRRSTRERRRRRPRERKRARPEPEPADAAIDDDDDDDDDAPEDVLIEDDEPEAGTAGEDLAIDDDEQGWGDGDSGGDSDSFVIDDDLDDVGPDARITAADLATDAASASGTGSTRLETQALAFLGTAIDVVHDAAPDPEAVSGLSPNGEDVITFRLHGRASGIGRFGRRVKVKVAGRFDADLALDSDTHLNTQRYEGRVWDTYADIYSSWLDVRAGNQFFAWGTADLLTPNDVINARDLRRGFLDHPDELRVPTLALSLTAHDGPFEAQAVYVPVAPVNEFELLSGDYALLGPHGATALERKVGAIVSALRDDPMLGPALQPILDIGEQSGRGIESGELGARVGLRFRKVDVFGYAFWGHERNPRIALADGLRELFATTDVGALDAQTLANKVGELGAMGVAAVDADYPRRVHVGGALATRLEPIGVKLDVGYTLDANVVLVPPQQGPLLGVPAAHDLLAATLSLDYNRGDQLSIVLEGELLRAFGVPPDVEVFQLDGSDLVVLGGQLQWSPGGGALQLRLLGFVEAREQLSYALRPALRLSGNDHVTLEVAGAIYGGPQASLGGIQDRNDEVQLVVQYGL